MLLPTPTTNATLAFRTGGFSTLVEGLDYAAAGDTGMNFYSPRGDLVRVLPEWQLPDIGVYAVYPAGRSLPAKTRSLIDFLAERFRPSAPWDLA